MSEFLKIKIEEGIDCEFIVCDSADYSSFTKIDKYISLNFNVYNCDESPDPKSIYIEEELSLEVLRSSSFESSKDGYFNYYKMLIPMIEALDNGSGLFITKDEIFWYKGNIYISMVENSDAITLDEVISKSAISNNYLELIGNNHSQSFSFSEGLISYCILRSCLISIQKNLLYKGSKSCSYDLCEKNSMERSNRDFLLSAIYVLDYLSSIGDLYEAERIINSLSYCYSLCTDIKSNCNCG